jgi:uncharacterized protein YecT (DUF1311 family)
VGYALIRFVAILIPIGLLGAPAFAQADKPNARDSAKIQDCVKTKTGHNWNWENCLGIVSSPCAKNEGSMTSSQVMDCINHEQLVWDDILNETFRRLRAKLDDTQQTKLRDMQRAWIVSRDKSCGFLMDYFDGSMATPMIADCVNRETGRRALYLLGFLNDVESK